MRLTTDGWLIAIIFVLGLIITGQILMLTSA
jgi:hypothetical protein